MKATKVKYLCNENLQELADDVNAFLRTGWELHGGLVVEYRGTSAALYTQGIKYTEEE